MTDRGDPSKAGSRIIRERAMAILRDTRARIDPALLAAMKERLSPKPASQNPPEEKIPYQPKEGVFKREYMQPEQQVAALGDVADENGMVPVDKQKIAQIVLQYMKNREEKQKH